MLVQKSVDVAHDTFGGYRRVWMESRFNWYQGNVTTLRLRPYYYGEIWKPCFHFENASNVFRPLTLFRRNLKSSVILRKTRSEESYDRVLIVGKLCFQLVWTVGLTVEMKLRFRDGLVWTVGLTVEIKLRFRDGWVWTVGLTVEITLRFRDGLVWTVGLTVEMKLRFQISPAYIVFFCAATDQWCAWYDSEHSFEGCFNNYGW